MQSDPSSHESDISTLTSSSRPSPSRANPFTRPFSEMVKIGKLLMLGIKEGGGGPRGFIVVKV